MTGEAPGLTRIRDLCIAAGLFLAPVAIYVPIDRWVAGLFYMGGGAFWLTDSWVGLAFREYLRPTFYWVLIAGVVALAIRGFLKANERWLTLRRLIYVAAVVGLGLGLVSNNILKDHFGRPRPMQTTEFGGEARYQPPVLPAKGCDSNCSFVSGDAAAGFVLIALPIAFAAGRRRRALMKAAIGFGVAVGLLRMMNGSHYFFDVVYAGLINVAIAAALYDPVVRWGREDLKGLPAAAAAGAGGIRNAAVHAWRWLRGQA